MKTISIKLLLLISVLFIAIGCEKDDAIREVENSTILKIPFHSESLSLETFSNRLPENGKQIKNLNLDQHKSSTGFKVDTANVEFKRFLDFESYTFAITSNNNTLQNLVVFKTQKNNKVGAFITQYDKQMNLENIIKLDKDFNLDFSKVSCSWEAQEFHTPPGSSTEWSYDGTNCQHMNDDGTTECTVRYSVVIDCPETISPGDSGGGGGWTGDGGSGATPPSTEPDPQPEPCFETGLTYPDGSCGGALTEPKLLSPFFVFTDRMDSDLKLKWNTLPQDQKNSIKAFLDEHKENDLYSDETVTFAEEVIKMWDENPEAEVDFEDRIINNLEGKSLDVYNNLKNLSSDFKNLIKKFEPTFPVSHLKFDLGDLGTARGQTIAPNSSPGTPNSPNYVITVRLNNNTSPSGVDQRPELLVAKTIIHEVIHAEMFRKLLSVLDNGGTITGVTRQDVIDALDGDFPGMYDYYRRHKNWQHQQMATHYSETLARALQQYDTGNAVPDNQLPSQLYMDLSWEGLRYPSINTWTNLSETEKDRINDVISDYIANN